MKNRVENSEENIKKIMSGIIMKNSKKNREKIIKEKIEEKK